jgi:Carboxypeptidase regulatory-like domain
MEGLLKAAAGVSSMWSLAAFCVAALVYVIARAKDQRGKSSKAILFAIGAIVVLGFIPIGASVYVATNATEANIKSIFRLRVIVLDPQSSPSEDAHVWSSIGGEPKQINGGWQFDIPSSSVPADRALTVYASVPSAHLKGQTEIRLSEDRNPSAKVQLQHPTSAVVQGIVTGPTGSGLSGALVSIVGYGDEAVRTNTDGSFRLSAHAADGEQVQVHVERRGYAPTTQGQIAGDLPVNVMLDRRR